MSEENVEIARRGFEAALRGDFDAIAQLLDPEVKWHAGDPTAAGACNGRAEALAFMRRGAARGPRGHRASRGPRAELVDAIDAGEKVVLILRQPSVHGEPGAFNANVTTFRDGKVIEMVHYPDPDEALAAAGVAAR